MDIKKNVVAAAISLLTLGIFGVAGAATPSSYTTFVDMNILYTGAIIDCRGLGLSTAMSPVIEDTMGRKVYGHLFIDPDAIVDRGMVGYAVGFDDAALARAGSNPIVLKALALRNHGVNPVIDLADATIVKYSIARNNYFRNAAVVFVR